MHWNIVLYGNHYVALEQCKVVGDEASEIAITVAAPRL